ncbi:MAG: 16S rRNA (cytosine(1402)-N(4))-methyltransferase RsmH [Planctomycetota bacterium]
MSAGRDDLSHLHQPVMVREVLAWLDVTPTREGLVVDGTLGLGGHAEAILEAAPRCRVLGLDRDTAALEHARTRLARFGDRVLTRHASYADVVEVVRDLQVPAPFGVLLDVGLSSFQLDDPERGFAFRFEDAPLDMRFDATDDGPTAAELVNTMPERELADLLFHHGDEPRSRVIARALVRARPLATVGDVAAVVRRHAARGRRHDPASRVFQALRIAVNDELGHLERGLRAAIRVLAPGGRLVVLAFHSGEERLVKDAFRAARAEGLGRPLTPKPIRPMEDETRRNPRARPTRLRAFERTPTEPQA